MPVVICWINVLLGEEQKNQQIYDLTKLLIADVLADL